MKKAWVTRFRNRDTQICSQTLSWPLLAFVLKEAKKDGFGRRPQAASEVAEEEEEVDEAEAVHAYKGGSRNY